MNYSRIVSVIPRLWRLPTSLFVLFATLAVSAAQAQSTSTGAISGTVTSASTRNALQGATVSIPSLNLIEFTDNAGRFVMKGVPVGAVDLVITYSGFNEGRQKVTVSNGAVTQADLELKTSDVLVMEAHGGLLDQVEVPLGRTRILKTGPHRAALGQLRDQLDALCLTARESR